MPRATSRPDESHLESLANLAGGIAHEFNNVLTVVLGYGGLVPDLASEPERLRQTMEHIVEAARRGADVVYQLQLFARTQECPRLPQDIHALLREGVVPTARQWPSSINVQIQLEPVAFVLPLNAAQFILAIQHLLQNAREALLLDHGHVTVRTTYHAEQEPPALCIAIEDTGTGMDPAQRDRACEPFFTTHQRSSGMRGLGLSVVYGIIQAHGGEIEIDSPTTGGTRVRLWLPCDGPSASPEPAAPFEQARDYA